MLFLYFLCAHLFGCLKKVDKHFVVSINTLEKHQHRYSKFPQLLFNDRVTKERNTVA